MKKSRFIEYFEGVNNRLSMSRLLSFMSIFPASIVLLWEHDAATLGCYLGAYTGGYVGGKFADRPVKREEQPQ